MQARIVMRGVLYQVLFTEAAEPQLADLAASSLRGGVTGVHPASPPPGRARRVRSMLARFTLTATPTIFRFRFALRSLPRVASYKFRHITLRDDDRSPYTVVRTELPFGQPKPQQELWVCVVVAAS